MPRQSHKKRSLTDSKKNLKILLTFLQIWISMRCKGMVLVYCIIDIASPWHRYITWIKFGYSFSLYSATAPVIIEDVFTNICNVLSLYTDIYQYTNTTLYRYDYKHANVFESIKNININIKSGTGETDRPSHARVHECSLSISHPLWC